MNNTAAAVAVTLKNTKNNASVYGIAAMLANSGPSFVVVNAKGKALCAGNDVTFLFSHVTRRFPTEAETVQVVPFANVTLA